MRRKLFLFFFFGTLSILCLFLLRFPAQAGALAANGLTLWFSKMIPALFPFMILSGLFLSTGFSNLVSDLNRINDVVQTNRAEFHAQNEELGTEEMDAAGNVGDDLNVM